MKVVVLGAGPTGLSVAWKLSSKCSVTVIDSSHRIGGVGYSFKHKDFILDYGPHKIYTQLPGIMDQFIDLVGDDLLVIRKKNSLRIKGKNFEFPLKISQIIMGLPIDGMKCLASYAESIVTPKKPEASYEDYVIKRFGKGIYRLLFRDFAWKVWGDPRQLTEELARRRIPVSSLSSLLKSMIIKDKEMSAEHFYYPKKGSMQIWDEMKKRIEKNKSKIILNTSPVSIKHGKKKGYEITLSNKKKISADFVVSTIPIHSMLSILKPSPPKEVVESSEKIKYKSAVIAYFILKKENALKDSWIFFPEKQFIFNRISEMRRFSKFTCPPGKTALMADITCEFGDKIWSMPEAEICRKALLDIEKAGIAKEEEVEECFIKKIPVTYPVYSIDYKPNLRKILDYLAGLENFLTIGRHGLFNYNNVDQCLDMGKVTAEHILSKGSGAEWEEKIKYFESYRIVD